GIGPFDIQSGTVLGYGKLNYQRGNLKLNFFANVLDGDAPALLAIGTDGRPITFFFENQTYDVELGNSHVLGSKHIVTYGGNYRHNSFDLSIAPGGDNRDEGGFYIQDEIFLSEHFRWNVGGRIDKFDVLDDVVFSPRTTFMVKPRPEHSLRFSFNKAFRAPSFVNNFLQVTILNQFDLGLVNPALAGRTFVFPINAVGNLDLKEESLTAYEVGYTGVIANRATVSAAFYVNVTEDSIFFTQGATYSSANPPPGWPLPPIVLDLMNAAGQGLPSQFTYLNFEEVTDKGIELSVDTSVNDHLRVFANYSWQDEPDPEGFDISELNLPPTHRFNAGFNANYERYFGNLSVSFTDDAFWQDVLDARFHGPTESYTLVNAGLGVRWAEGKVTTAIKVSNLTNEEAQQHVFGDIIRRQIFGELRFSF
ncbi:MAG: TonB-dependent receptor plug domain-containing protein, partial [Acidobacteriota bacterium]